MVGILELYTRKFCKMFVYKPTNILNMLKISLLFTKYTNFTVNSSRNLAIENAIFSGYYIYMNLNIWGDFQICISVLVNVLQNIAFLFVKTPNLYTLK